MGSEISLIEIVMVKYKKDDKTFLETLNGFDWTYPDWEQCTEELPKPDEREFWKPYDTIFIEDCYGFRLNFVGDNHDFEYASGLDYEYHAGYVYIFEGFEEDLIAIGEKLIGEYTASLESMKERTDVKMVRFLTVWEYNSWVDSYWNEFDSDWNLLGLVKMNDIKSLIDKES